jgi:hypothetical protein
MGEDCTAREREGKAGINRDESFRQAFTVLVLSPAFLMQYFVGCVTIDGYEDGKFSTDW